MQGQITIHELTAMLLAEFRRAGYSESTIWRNYMPDIRTIEKYYEKTSHVFYDPFVTEESKGSGMIGRSSPGITFHLTWLLHE